jgi:hypothetical protein
VAQCPIWKYTTRNSGATRVATPMKTWSRYVPNATLECMADTPEKFGLSSGEVWERNYTLTWPKCAAPLAPLSRMTSETAWAGARSNTAFGLL